MTITQLSKAHGRDLQMVEELLPCMLDIAVNDLLSVVSSFDKMYDRMVL
jgi:hypothetical protein